MRVLFFTQSKSLDVFYQLYLRIKKDIQIDKVGFYVANLLNYEKFVASHPDFEKKHTVLKEWDVYKDSLNHIPNLERIKTYENRIGDPTLWSPIVTDRRIYLGQKSTFFQDYSPKLTHLQMLGILDISLQKIEELFETVKPDLVCTLYTATMGDCLAHHFAKSQNMHNRSAVVGFFFWRNKNIISAKNTICKAQMPSVRRKYQLLGVKAQLIWHSQN